MMRHSEIAGDRFARSRALKELIDSGQIAVGGNSSLKIYGTLSCKSGKRMQISNRVFFKDELEALAAGYRPCGHCMRQDYQKWKVLNSFQKNPSEKENN
ncbi:MAG: metal-binding protein [Mucilaginibacter sp.]|nr:metal-binding protein [Mucilaginibacter sp.]